MSQQPQQPPTQQGQQIQQPQGQIGQQAGQIGQQPQHTQMSLPQQQLPQLVGNGFSQATTPQISEAVIALDRLETVAEYAHSRMMQQGNYQAAMLADAIEAVSRLQKELVVTANPLVQEVSQCSEQVIQAAIGQLQQHSQQPEIQELVSECQQTIQQVPQSLQQAGWFRGGQSGQGSF